MMTMKNDSDKEKKDIVEPDEYDIHYHRYTLQFKFIPELIDRVNEDNWDVRVLTDKAWWRERLEEAEDDFYFDWDALVMEHRRLDDGNVLILYRFPKPIRMPEALYGAVLLDTTAERASYYTLESSQDDSWCVGNPTTEAHCNRGFVDTDDLQCFIDRVVELNARR